MAACISVKLILDKMFELDPFFANYVENWIKLTDTNFAFAETALRMKDLTESFSSLFQIIVNYFGSELIYNQEDIFQLAEQLKNLFSP
ncbi:hypothetical protein [Endozoicomonas sp. Mp262]|uniref:hypothetical protein n=1 Tax=Endozoicomonas sp. Mp262 TaxID=2919499 RepID=UPI0021DB704F